MTAAVPTIQTLPTQPLPPSTGFSASPEATALTVELAKALKLVAPTSMNAEAQMVWLQAAVDALEGIRAAEVSAISAELRRTVTRPSQIVPEIARLVAEKRKRPTVSVDSQSDRTGAEGHAAYGNAHLAKIGRTDVHWVVREGNAVIEWK